MTTNNLNNMNWFDLQAEKFENGRFGLMTVLMTAQSCFGSIAAMLALQSDNFVFLSVITAITMASNGAFIAQAPAKWCLGIFYAAVMVNTIAIITLLAF
jgi:hypothetical protein